MSRDEESIQVDSYLDALLAERFRAGWNVTRDVPEPLRSAADSVQRALPRFHPSFAFEERLARRLLGADEPAPTSPGDEAEPASPAGELPHVVIPFPAPVRGLGADAAPADRRTRGVLLGGAIASGVSIAGVSIAGAALLARRRAKPSATVV